MSGSSYMPDLLNRPGGLLGGQDGAVTQGGLTGGTHITGPPNYASKGANSSIINPDHSSNALTSSGGAFVSGRELMPSDVATGAPATHPDTQGRFSNRLDGNGPAGSLQDGSEHVRPVDGSVSDITEGHRDRVVAGKEVFPESVLHGAPAVHPDQQGKDTTHARGLGHITPTPGGQDDVLDGSNVLAGKEVFNKADLAKGDPVRHPDLQGHLSNSADFNGPVVHSHGKENIHEGGVPTTGSVRAGKEVFPSDINDGPAPRHPDPQTDISDATARLHVDDKGGYTHFAPETTAAPTAVGASSTGIAAAGGFSAADGADASRLPGVAGAHSAPPTSEAYPHHKESATPQDGKRKTSLMGRIKKMVKPDTYI